MPYVADAVEHVLAQDAALELLFVNVDSTDGSLQQVSSIDDDRIRVIEAPAGTAPGPARNDGTEPKGFLEAARDGHHLCRASRFDARGA